MLCIGPRSTCSSARSLGITGGQSLLLGVSGISGSPGTVLMQGDVNDSSSRYAVECFVNRFIVEINHRKNRSFTCEAFVTNLRLGRQPEKTL